MDQNSAFDLEVKENCPNGVVSTTCFMSCPTSQEGDRQSQADAGYSSQACALVKKVEELPYLLYKRPENLSEKGAYKTGGA